MRIFIIIIIILSIFLVLKMLMQTNLPCAMIAISKSGLDTRECRAVDSLIECGVLKEALLARSKKGLRKLEACMEVDS